MTTRWLTSRELAAWTRLASVLELLPSLLDAQLRRDAGLTHFDYRVLAILSECEGGTMRMTALAGATNATLPRVSHVVQRLEDRGYVQRAFCSSDRRARNVGLTEAGWEKIRASAPGHVETVREHVIDALSPAQIDQLAQITQQLLERLDRDAAMGTVYQRHTVPGLDDERGDDAFTDAVGSDRPPSRSRRARK